MSASTGNTATLSGAAAMIAVAPVPDIGFILQAVGVGALVGTAVVLQLEWRQRRRGFETNTDLRWAIVARWTVLFAAVAIVVDMAARIFGGGTGAKMPVRATDAGERIGTPIGRMLLLHVDCGWAGATVLSALAESASRLSWNTQASGGDNRLARLRSRIDIWLLPIEMGLGHRNGGIPCPIVSISAGLARFSARTAA